jgi:hypothetical protein
MYDIDVNQEDVTGNTCSLVVVQESTQNVEEGTQPRLSVQSRDPVGTLKSG